MVLISILFWLEKVKTAAVQPSLEKLYYHQTVPGSQSMTAWILDVRAKPGNCSGRTSYTLFLKSFERVVGKQLCDYLHRKGLFKEFYFGFRAYHCTDTACFQSAVLPEVTKVVKVKAEWGRASSSFSVEPAPSLGLGGRHHTINI